MCVPTLILIPQLRNRNTPAQLRNKACLHWRADYSHQNIQGTNLLRFILHPQVLFHELSVEQYNLIQVIDHCRESLFHECQCDDLTMKFVSLTINILYHTEYTIKSIHPVCMYVLWPHVIGLFYIRAQHVVLEDGSIQFRGTLTTALHP